MSNYIKHGTSLLPSAIEGNQSFGFASFADYGPSSATGFYNGITPPSGGYTIYVDRTTGGPSIHVAHNDTQCIFFLKSFGSTGTSITDVLIWASGQSNIYVATADFAPTSPFNTDCSYSTTYGIYTTHNYYDNPFWVQDTGISCYFIP